jgi:ferredoxin
MRADFTDPIYRARRERAVIISVNCTHPAETCFCTSMDTGPQVKKGFDLNITELDDVFVLTVGSELARRLLTDIPFENASGYILTNVEHKIGHAKQQMRRTLDTSDLPELILDNLDHPYWNKIGKRCLSCTNCTLVCPTCFCWDTVDEMSLDGKATRRENASGTRVSILDIPIKPAGIHVQRYIRDTGNGFLTNSGRGNNNLGHWVA